MPWHLHHIQGLFAANTCPIEPRITTQHAVLPKHGAAAQQVDLVDHFLLVVDQFDGDYPREYHEDAIARRSILEQDLILAVNVPVAFVVQMLQPRIFQHVQVRDLLLDSENKEIAVDVVRIQQLFGNDLILQTAIVLQDAVEVIVLDMADGTVREALDREV